MRPRSSTYLALLAAAIGCATPPPSPPPETPPPHRSFVLESIVLREARPIHVYSPPQAQVDARLPVLYVLDGGLHEDFAHVANTVATLVAAGEIRPVHVVGIENTERRRDVTPETTVASDREIAPRVGGAAAFRSFVRNELIPEVEKRLSPGDERALVGESLAGLFVVDTFFTEPKLFDHYIAISPSLWWNDRAIPRAIDALLARRGAAGGSLFLTAANEDTIATDAGRIGATIEGVAPPGLRFRYVAHPELEHGTIFRAVEAEAYRFAFGP